LADLNGDKYPDIVEVNSKGMPSYIYYSNGGMKYRKQSFGSSKLDAKSVDLGDVDGDGQADIVIGNRLGENEIYVLDSEGKPGESMKFGVKEVHTMDVTLADVNNDQKLDILVANFNGANELFLNKGDLVFDHQSITDKKFETTAIFSFDVNGDGINDVVETNFEHLNLYYISHISNNRSVLNLGEDE